MMNDEKYIYSINNAIEKAIIKSVFDIDKKKPSQNLNYSIIFAV